MAITVTRSAGMLLLSIWLILTGLAGLVALPAVSTDGKTITATQSGTNAQGQSVNNVTVLDKQ